MNLETVTKNVFVFLVHITRYPNYLYEARINHRVNYDVV